MNSTSSATAIDIHTHMVPAAFPASLGSRIPAGWPAMAPAHACHRHVMIDGKVFRTVSDQCWDVSRRLSDCDAMGVGIQAISPMPELLSYWLDIDASVALAAFLNDQLAEMVVQGQGRIAAFGTVPLCDVDRAIRELERIMATPGFVGVEIGSNINGVPIAAPQFDAFFEAAADLDAAVFVHALKPVGKERLVGPAQLMQALAFPTDVGLAAAAVITSGMLLKHPRLRIAFSHGGGTLAALLPRLEQAHQVFDALRDSMAVAPTLQARRMYYDTLVFDSATLRHLVQTFGDTQLMIGTDYPFAFRESDPCGRITEAGFSAETSARLTHGNAENFLLHRHGAHAC